MKQLLTACLAMLLASCWQQDVEVEGYAPVYVDAAQVKEIKFTTAKPVENGGKVYVLGTTLFQVETGKGIHVFDITTPSSPQNKGFISVVGCQEIAAKSNHIYTNNMDDLVILNASATGVNVVKRLPGTFTSLKLYSRPPESGKFECPDPKKGTVIGWEKKTIVNPKCFY